MRETRGLSLVGHVVAHVTGTAELCNQRGELRDLRERQDTQWRGCWFSVDLSGTI